MYLEYNYILCFNGAHENILYFVLYRIYKNILYFNILYFVFQILDNQSYLNLIIWIIVYKKWEIFTF